MTGETETRFWVGVFWVGVFWVGVFVVALFLDGCGLRTRVRRLQKRVETIESQVGIDPGEQNDD